MNKEKLIFFGSIGVVILIMVIYGLSVFSKKTTSATAIDFTVPDLVEKDKTKEQYNNRLKIANAYQEPQEKQDLSKTVDFKTYQSEPNKVKEKNDTSKADLNRPIQKKTLTPTNTTKEASSKNEIKEQKDDDPGGFGIVVSDRSGSNEKNSSNSHVKNGGFFSAMLEEDTKIKNQSSVVFFLLEDCTIDGSVFKKNSILYGKASEHGSVFDINIYQIMNTDGNIAPVTGLLVFDEKYSRGLAYEGSLNESVREGMGQTTNEASSSLSSGIAAGTGVGIAANAVDNTIKAMTRKKEASINLYKGYRVFIKKE
jgi:hypothetical protein